jgi:Cytochrome C oxidase, cbb3-type, subunit III
VNPVLYMEYEQINEADKIIKEVEGHDIESDHAVANAITRQTLDHELELKLLLSSTFKGWNVAVNPLATRNLLPTNPWEFGYAVGASRPLALKPSPDACNFCRENFIGGIEMYGGLGDTQSFGLHDTSHYIAPVVALRLSPGFGLNENSHRLLLRRGFSREFSGFGEALRGFLDGHKMTTNRLCGYPAGRKLFLQHCAECHERTAERGRKAPHLHALEVQSATPGMLFWILTNGVIRRGMPVWSKLPEPERWQIVSFLKSLPPLRK